jgi:DNA-binding GntR family transcriptional regulator
VGLTSTGTERTAGTAHQRLAEELLAEITAGRYSIGDRLPTEAALCQRTGLARGTVRQALRRIEELGMIHRRPGDGTRLIALQPVDDYQPVAGTADDIVTLVERTKILRPATRTVVADGELADRIGAPPRTAWYLVEGPRVRRHRIEPPLCWSEQYLDTSQPGRDKLLRGDFTAAEARAHATEQVVSAALLDERFAAALEAEPGGPALVVTRRRRDERGRLISVGIHTHPADRYQLRTVVR